MKKILLGLSIITLLFLLRNDYENNYISEVTPTSTSAIASIPTLKDETPGFIFMENFIELSRHMEEELASIRDREVVKLTTDDQTGPIRYCGEYFFCENSDIYYCRGGKLPALITGEAFDCREFGIGNSLVKRIKNDIEESRNDDGDFIIYQKIKNVYTIGDFILTVEDMKDYVFREERSFCDLSISQKNTILFHVASQDYPCGTIFSIEYDDQALLVIQTPRMIGNTYGYKAYLVFIAGDKLRVLGSYDMEIGDGLSSKNAWVSDNAFYFWEYDARYEFASAGSHAASTYAFLPRIFKIFLSNGSIQVIEGPNVSSEIKEVYLDQLDQAKTIFNEWSANQITNEPSVDYVFDAALAYWVGMAKYTLPLTELKNELQSIEQIIQKHDISYLYGINSLADIYSDLGTF